MTEALYCFRNAARSIARDYSILDKACRADAPNPGTLDYLDTSPPYGQD